jgi:hypothetical protein
MLIDSGDHKGALGAQLDGVAVARPTVADDVPFYL